VIGTNVEHRLERLERIVDADDEVRRVWEMVDLLLAVLRGAVRFGVATDPRGFVAVNEYA
jgi:hypothetical protein